jgi:hypothetical protein
LKALKFKYLIFLLITIAYILCNGYLFNTGDQAEHLPQVYQKLNPSLYPNDFFLSYYNNTFTVRYYFVWLVYVFSAFLGVSQTCFIIYFICLYASIAGIYFLINHFYNNTFKTWLGVILYLFVFRHFTVGGNYLQDNMLVGSSIAEALCIWAFIAHFKNKYFVSGLFCGLAALFQPLIGMQVALIIGIHIILQQIITKQINLKNILSFGLSFLVLALFILTPVFLYQTHNNTSNQVEANKILFEYRGALHYLPKLFPVKDYLLLGIFTLTAIGILAFKAKAERTHFVPIILSIVIVCMIVAAILFINPNSNIGKIQWYKTTVWLGLFCSIICVNVIPPKYVKSISISIFSLTFCYVIVVYFIFSESGYSLINRKSISTETHEWIKENTPQNALFLAPPNDYSFNCEAQRSTAVNYKAIVHETNYLIAWKNAMEKYYEMDFTKIERLDCLPSAVKGFYNIDFSNYQYQEIDYVLLAKYPRLQAKYNQEQVCYENNDYVVLKLK